MANVAKKKPRIFLKEIIIQAPLIKIQLTVLNILCLFLSPIILASLTYNFLTGFLIMLDICLTVFLAELIEVFVRRLGGAKLFSFYLNSQGFYASFRNSSSNVAARELAPIAKLVFLLLVTFLHAAFYRRNLLGETCYAEPRNVATIISYIILAIAIWNIFPVPQRAGWKIFGNVITTYNGKIRLKNFPAIGAYLVVIIGLWGIFSAYFPLIVEYNSDVYCKNTGNILVIVIYMFVTIGLPLGLTLELFDTPRRMWAALNIQALTEGVDLLKTGEFEQARDIFTLALENLPDRVDLIYYVARAEYGLKNYPKVIPGLLKVIELSPQSPQINLFLGQVYCLIKNYEAALEYVNKELELNPSVFYAYYYRVYIYRKLKRYQDMLENSKSMFTYATTLQEQIMAHSWMGNSLLNTGNFIQAIEYYNVVILSQSQNEELQAESLVNRVWCYLHLGKIEEAQTDLKENVVAKKMHWGWYTTWLDLAIHKTENARQAFITYLENFQAENEDEQFLEFKEILLTLLRADINNSTKEIEPLEARLEKLMAKDLNKTLGYYWLSQVYKALGETEKSAAAKQKALDDFLPPILAEDVI